MTSENTRGNKEGFREKIKTFFHLSKDEELSGGTELQTTMAAGALTKKYGAGTFQIEKLMRDLETENDIAVRMKALNTLETMVSTRRLETNFISSIWSSMEDLILTPNGDSSFSAEVCQLQSLKFSVALIRAQFAQLETIRPRMFDVIERLYADSGSDSSSQLKSQLFECLKVLTNDGSVVSGFGERIAQFLLVWTADVFAYEKGVSGIHSVEFLTVIQYVIRDNAAFWDEDQIFLLISELCNHALQSKTLGEIEQCLSVLDTILCYSLIPRSQLPLVMAALCKLVNKETLCGQCWRLARSIFGSHLGNGAIHTLCSLLQASETFPDVSVLRGAVYFIGMALWGSQRIDTLRHRPAAVLPSFQSALSARSLIVTFEILLSLQRLIQKYGRDLQLVTWHVVLELIENTIYSLEDCVQGDEERQWQRLLHEIITCVENLYENNSFGGSAEQLFTLVERCARQRPENSILRLLSYRAQAINPLKHGWLNELSKLLRTYYCDEVRCSIRIKALTILRNVYTEQKHLYDRDIVETVVLPLLENVSSERDHEVQEVSINFLCDVAKHWYDAESLSWVIENSGTQKATDLFYDVVALVESLINGKLRQFNCAKKLDPEGAGLSESTFQYFDNVEKAVCGILEILEAKWCAWPPSHCFHLLNILATHVTLNYEKGAVGYLGGNVRERIFQCLLQLRADPSSHRLGIQFHQTDNEDQVLLSPYAICSVKCLDLNSSNDEQESTGRQEEDAFKWTVIGDCVVECLKKELWWPALKVFFKFLPGLLQNRILVLSSPESVSDLCSALVQLTADQQRAGRLVNAPENFTMAELNDAVCSSLAPLVAYRSQLDLDLQKKLVLGIQTCLASERSTSAVVATLGCALELPDAVGPVSRELVRRLSELPSSAIIVIPVMELLSTLLRIGSIHQYFTEKQFHHVMDCLVPCTNPEKFTTFIVSMGYHILFRWFLAAPMKYRQSLASYILNGIDMDSFSRKNSMKQIWEEIMTDDAGSQLASDMKDTLREFLNQYSFTDTPPQWGQNRVIESLIAKQGTSKSWIVGSRIFTVTTVVSNGRSDFLCTKCHAYLKKQWPIGSCPQSKQRIQQITLESSSTNPAAEFLNARRRHASAVQKKVTQGPPASALTSMDDSYICTSPKMDRACISRGVRFSGTEKEVEERVELPVCACWCQGYAVVDIRHSFGRTSWLVKISEGQLDSASTEILRSAVLRLGEAIDRTGSSMSRTRRSNADLPRNLSDTMLLMNFDAELINKGNDSEKSEAALSRNSSISMKSGPSTGQPQTSGVADTDTGDLPVEITLFTPEDGNVECTTPTSTTSSAYYSVRSMDQKQKEEELLGCEFLRIDPAWVFTQLCGWTSLLNMCALPDKSSALNRSFRLLDLIRPEETHKIGVVYAAPRQQKEEEMLGNHFGSERYARFLEGLGELISLRESDPQRTFLGGLNPDGSDGKFTYYWHDQVTQVVFHVSSLMPNVDKDPSFNKKKMHIGNDHVVIFFNETGKEYKMGTISGELSYVVIVVEPEDSETLSVKLKAKDEISRWLSLKSAVISDEEAPLLCRQMAMRAELSAKIWWAQQRSPDQPYLSSSLERLREIRKIRDKFQG